MSNKLVLTLLFLVCVCLIAKTAWNMHLQSNGVCVELGRPLTDQEKFHAVIERMNRSHMREVKEQILGNLNSNFKPYSGYVPRSRIPFASVDAFLKENPDCCSIEVRDTDYNGESDWALSKAMGAYAGHVTIKYKLHYIDEHGKERVTLDTMVWTIQNCGTVN